MYDRATANLLVVFREGGPAAFFRDPLHELFQVSLSLDDWLRPQPLRETTERLVEAKDNRQRIGIIERFLLSERKEIEADRLVLQAVQAIKEAHGQLKIKALLTDLPLSRDPFEKRFRRVVGTSPKQYATIVRFRTLIAGSRPVDSLTTVAHRAGYFDQAHFIKDFKSFTGKSPKDFFAADSYW
jgi:AraC-like DNA-binding protein